MSFFNLWITLQTLKQIMWKTKEAEMTEKKHIFPIKNKRNITSFYKLYLRFY